MLRVVGKLIKFLGLALIALIVVITVRSILWPPSAMAELGNDRWIKMVISPLFGFHSDYERKFVVTQGWQRTVVHVFEDTGWWRATTLYQAEDGRFILIDYAIHELLFCEDQIKVNPPGYQGGIIQGREKIEACSGMDIVVDAPLAQHWNDAGQLRYIGVFLEPRDGEPFQFKSWRDLPEPAPETYDYGG